MTGEGTEGAVAGELRGKQRRYLRGLGHGLEPVVLLGREGMTDGIVRSVADALEAHELIKVRLPETEGAERKKAARELAGKSQAHLVQVLGRMVLLYRAREEKPEIRLPA